VVLSRDGEVIKSIVAFGGSGWLAVWAPVKDERLTISFVENDESVLECSFGAGNSVAADFSDCDLASIRRVDTP
jgi:hypothetical protein